MLAKFQLKSGAQVEFSMDAFAIKILSKSGNIMDWKLISLKVFPCKPIRCNICNEIVATQHELYTNSRKESIFVKGKIICIDCCDEINSILDDNPYDRSP
jgi:formylmethanofuran dehydrogenase subunit E